MRKALLIPVLLAAHAASAQYVYTISADSVKLTSSCDSTELILMNHTQGVPGFLFNTGNGRTVFQRGLVELSDSTYLVGADTLHIPTTADYVQLNPSNYQSGNVEVGGSIYSAGSVYAQGVIASTDSYMEVGSSYMTDIYLAGPSVFTDSIGVYPYYGAPAPSFVVSPAGVASYEGDYGSLFGSGSLVDKRYVDSSLSHAVGNIKTENGDTLYSGGAVGLGGTLVNDSATVNLNTYTFQLQDYHPGVDSNQFIFSPNAVTWQYNSPYLSGSTSNSQLNYVSAGLYLDSYTRDEFEGDLQASPYYFSYTAADTTTANLESSNITINTNDLSIQSDDDSMGGNLNMLPFQITGAAGMDNGTSQSGFEFTSQGRGFAGGLYSLYAGGANWGVRESASADDNGTRTEWEAIVAQDCQACSYFGEGGSSQLVQYQDTLMFESVSPSSVVTPVWVVDSVGDETIAGTLGITNTHSGSTTGGVLENTTSSFSWGTSLSPVGGALYTTGYHNLLDSFGSSETIAPSVTLASQFDRLTIVSTSSSDVEMTATGGGTPRVLSAEATQLYLPGIGSGINTTVSDVAAVDIKSAYQDPGTTNSVRAVNYYQLLIEPSTETMAIDTDLNNTYGIYQVGAADTNVFRGPISYNNMYSTSSAPSVSGSTGAGTSPSVGLDGTTNGGEITITTGSSPSASATVASITFAGSFAFPTGCSVVLFPGNSAAAALSSTQAVYATGGTTGWIVKSGSTALAASTTYVWNYQISGY